MIKVGFDVLDINGKKLEIEWRIEKVRGIKNKFSRKKIFEVKVELRNGHIEYDENWHENHEDITFKRHQEFLFTHPEEFPPRETISRLSIIVPEDVVRNDQKFSQTINEKLKTFIGGSKVRVTFGHYPSERTF